MLDGPASNNEPETWPKLKFLEKCRKILIKQIVRIEWNQIDNQIAGIRFVNYIGQKSREFGNFSNIDRSNDNRKSLDLKNLQIEKITVYYEIDTLISGIKFTYTNGETDVIL